MTDPQKTTYTSELQALEPEDWRLAKSRYRFNLFNWIFFGASLLAFLILFLMIADSPAPFLLAILIVGGLIPYGIYGNYRTYHKRTRSGQKRVQSGKLLGRHRKKHKRWRYVQGKRRQVTSYTYHLLFEEKRDIKVSKKIYRRASAGRWLAIHSFHPMGEIIRMEQIDDK